MWMAIDVKHNNTTVDCLIAEQVWSKAVTGPELAYNGDNWNVKKLMVIKCHGVWNKYLYG